VAPNEPDAGVALTPEQDLALAKLAIGILTEKLDRANQRLARQSREFTEGIAEEIRKAKSQAWQACLLAHLELVATGDISVLDDPYEVGESA